jgi:putative oxygen-independent coproporphyrinogen III oxidase
MSVLSAPPLSLYVHMPWCVRKCPYCDFNSHAAPERIPQQAYIAALLDDLDQDLPAAAGRPLVSIFFGGGTPSLFSAEAIDEFLSGVRARIAFADDIEITLETNPGTLERGRFAGYKAAGVNRISLGAQTFDERQLQTLGRIHGADDIHRAVEELNSAGLDNFNLDLMYALPEQSVEAAICDLRLAIALKPTHLSHYQLTLEPGTVFYHRPPPLPDQDASWDMQLACQEVLAGHGYHQYEISGYAQPERRCRHNLNYWLFGDYIGIGAGAHGKLTDVAQQRVVRTVRHRQPREYLRQPGAARTLERRVVGREELPLEFMLNALRLNDGFSVSDFEERTGLALATITTTLRHAERKAMLTATDERWRASDLGRRFLNDLQSMFLPDSRQKGEQAPLDVRLSGTTGS